MRAEYFKPVCHLEELCWFALNNGENMLLEWWDVLIQPLYSLLHRLLLFNQHVLSRRFAYTSVQVALVKNIKVLNQILNIECLILLSGVPSFGFTRRLVLLWTSISLQKQIVDLFVFRILVDSHFLEEILVLRQILAWFEICRGRNSRGKVSLERANDVLDILLLCLCRHF